MPESASRYLKGTSQCPTSGYTNCLGQWRFQGWLSLFFHPGNISPGTNWLLFSGSKSFRTQVLSGLLAKADLKCGSSCSLVDKLSADLELCSQKLGSEMEASRSTNYNQGGRSLIHGNETVSRKCLHFIYYLFKSIWFALL